jgi:hypothetical protein
MDHPYRYRPKLRVMIVVMVFLHTFSTQSLHRSPPPTPPLIPETDHVRFAASASGLLTEFSARYREIRRSGPRRFQTPLLFVSPPVTYGDGMVTSSRMTIKMHPHNQFSSEFKIEPIIDSLPAPLSLLERS